tara:strand:- start:265 stop:444 length:180 start_codon:yes stop_codon:yes gene_type:complete
MEQDRKEYRRSNFKQKKNGKSKDNLTNEKQEKKIKSAFKHRKMELEEEEIWEQWQEQYR